MKKIAIVLLIGLAASAWAQVPAATLRDFTGKVELKAPGGDWKVAVKGAKLDKNTAVSTGFKSTAVLVLGESVLTVKPLTRLTLEEIVRQSGSDEVSLYLLAGRVRAEVKAPIGKTVKFSVKSPTATASVRGTGFDFDSVNVEVFEGLVEFLGSGGGPAVPVPAGLSSFVNADGGATGALSAEEKTIAVLTVMGGMSEELFGVSPENFMDLLTTGGSGNLPPLPTVPGTITIGW